jgi:hypothetical protein
MPATKRSSVVVLQLQRKAASRVLLELHDGGENDSEHVQVIPKIGHEMLAEMVGTTRSRSEQQREQQLDRAIEVRVLSSKSDRAV